MAATGQEGMTALDGRLSTENAEKGTQSSGRVSNSYMKEGDTFVPSSDIPVTKDFQFQGALPSNL